MSCLIKSILHYTHAYMYFASFFREHYYWPFFCYLSSWCFRFLPLSSGLGLQVLPSLHLSGLLRGSVLTFSCAVRSDWWTKQEDRCILPKDFDLVVSRKLWCGMRGSETISCTSFPLLFHGTTHPAHYCRKTHYSVLHWTGMSLRPRIDAIDTHAEGLRTYHYPPLLPSS